jgi:hypothetical protein
VIRENAATKARRLLAEGRLMIEAASSSEPFLAAVVRGDSGRLYRCGFELDADGWFCSCDAKGRCSHVQALMLVFVPSAAAIGAHLRHPRHGREIGEDVLTTAY